jgi:inorganic pyrophosphatase
MDRGMVDHKLVCSVEPMSEGARAGVLRFFRFYAHAKGLLNVVRGQFGRNACEGWIAAEQAIGCARPRDAAWHGPSVGF